MDDFVYIDKSKYKEPKEITQEINKINVSAIVALEIVDKSYAQEGHIVHRKTNGFLLGNEMETIPCGGFLEKANIKIMFTVTEEDQLLGGRELFYCVEKEENRKFAAVFGVEESKKIILAVRSNNRKRNISDEDLKKKKKKKEEEERMVMMSYEDENDDNNNNFNDNNNNDNNIIMEKKEEERKMDTANEEEEEEEEVDNNNWECKLCTYVNKPTSLRCNMCLTHRGTGGQVFSVTVPLLPGLTSDINPLKDSYHVIKFLGTTPSFNGEPTKEVIWKIKMRVNPSKDEVELISMGDSLMMIDMTRISENIRGIVNWFDSYRVTFIGTCERVTEAFYAEVRKKGVCEK